MRLRVWCRALDDTITPCLCYRSCTGFRFDVGWFSRRPRWSICHCPAWLLLIWPPTVSRSPTKVVVSCVLPYQGHVLSDGYNNCVIDYLSMPQSHTVLTGCTWIASTNATCFTSATSTTRILNTWRNSIATKASQCSGHLQSIKL